LLKANQIKIQNIPTIVAYVLVEQVYYLFQLIDLGLFNFWSDMLLTEFEFIMFRVDENPNKVVLLLLIYYRI